MGQEFEFIDCRKCWGEVRVFYYAADGQLTYIPERWTTLQAKDPFVEVANGAVVARPEDLLSLAQIVKSLTPETCKGKDAAKCKHNKTAITSMVERRSYNM